MVCIYCNGKTKVINSRYSIKRAATWRRRQCLKCGAAFTTRELADYESSLRVMDSTGAMRPFLRDKIFVSLYGSLSHRQTSLSDAQALTGTIISNLLNHPHKGVISTKEVIGNTKEVLSKFDIAAYTHYSAHHPG